MSARADRMHEYEADRLPRTAGIVLRNRLNGPEQVMQLAHERAPQGFTRIDLLHYLFELFALDSWVDVPAVGQSPSATRAAVTAAMAGHVRGKGVLVGTYRRPAP